MAALLMCGLAILLRLWMVSAVRLQLETRVDCPEQDVNEIKDAIDQLSRVLLPALSWPTNMSSLGEHSFRSIKPLILDSCVGAGTFGVVIKGHFEGAAERPVAVKRSILGDCSSLKYQPTRVRNSLGQSRRELLRYMRINASKGEKPSQPGSSTVPTFHDSAEGCVHGQYMSILVLDLLPTHWPFQECTTAAKSGQEQACPDLSSSEVDELWRELTEGYRFLCNNGIAQSDGWIENQLVIKESDDDGGGHHVRLIDFDKAHWVATARDYRAPIDEVIGHCGYDLDILQRHAKVAEERPRWPPSAKLKRFFQALNKLGDVKHGEGLRTPGPGGQRIKPLPEANYKNLWNLFAEKPREADEVYRGLLKKFGSLPSSTGLARSNSLTLAVILILIQALAIWLAV